MGCTRWTEEGLLFAANELSASEKETFQYHLSECEHCRREFSEYSEMKRRFLSPDMLHDSPSPAVDAEILRTCSARNRLTSIASGFFALTRKAAISAAFLFVGFAGMGYYAYMMHDAKAKASAVASRSMQPTPAPSPSPSIHAPTQSSSPPVFAQVQADSAHLDSASQSRPFSQTRGSMAQQGVRAVGAANDQVSDIFTR